MKDTSDNEIGVELLPFKEGIFYKHCPVVRTTHTTAFATRVVGHWLEQYILRNEVLIYGVMLVLLLSRAKTNPSLG